MEYIDAKKLRSEVERLKETGCESPISVCDDILSFIDYLQDEQSKSRLIKVKCVKPHDTSWEIDKVYTCEIWHHGDMDMDFYDVYYDYWNNPNYVQFSNIKMLNEEFIILQDEQPDVDLELEKEMDSYYGLYRKDGKTYGIDDGEEYADWRDFVNPYAEIALARHFYELGLRNARKEEKQCQKK